MAIKTHIIVIKDNPISEKYAKITRKSLELNGYEYEVLDAVVPETISDNAPELEFGDRLTPTEKACFVSHYTLWRHCARINQRIAIIEHDSIMVRPYPEYPKHTAFVCFVTNPYPHPTDPSIVRNPTMYGGGYILKPQDAMYLIGQARGRINNRQLDTFLSMCYEYREGYPSGLPFERHKCLIANNVGPVTIDHGKQ